ncbi:MFS transporter, partial [Brucella sp. 21LCYQ03]|nr:MFS transporter [Brucella sp. 21LCYQ03]
MPSIFASNNLQKPTYSLLLAVCVAHLFNDLLQSVIPAIYPRLEAKYDLSMAQIGVITLCFQLAASIFQPVVGAYTDKHPKPYSQMAGMLFSTAGMISLAYAANYEWILISVILVGIGSSIFH